MHNYYSQKRFEFILLSLVLFYSMSLFFQLRTGNQSDILAQLDVYAFSLIGLMLVYMYFYMKSAKLRRTLDFNSIAKQKSLKRAYQMVSYFPYIGLFIVALAQVEVGFIPFMIFFYLWLGILFLAIILVNLSLSRLQKATKV